MEFVCYDGWSPLADSADSLFTEGGKKSVFFTRPWYESLSKHSAGECQDILLACVVDGPRVMAMLPLMRSGPGHWRALTNLYASLYTLLLTDHRTQEVVACLARGLAELPFSSLRLEPIAEDDGAMLALQQAVGAYGIDTQRHFRFYNWIHRTDGQTFRDYMAERPAKLRNTINRKARRLEREHGYTIRLYCGNDTEQGLHDYNTVYAKSWKANELYSGFIDDLAHALAASGWLRLAILYAGKKPVAAQFWFVVHDKASIFKLAYDEEWKHYSPGSILTAYLMEHVIDHDKVAEIDFLTGNDAYKQDWMSLRRMRQALYLIKTPVPAKRGNRWLDKLRGLRRQQQL